MYHKLTYTEFIGWQEYFKRRPYQWREDDRTFKIMRSFGYEGKPESVFGALDPIYHPVRTVQEGQISVQNLKGSALFLNMLSAKGGDKLEVFDGDSG